MVAITVMENFGEVELKQLRSNKNSVLGHIEDKTTSSIPLSSSTESLGRYEKKGWKNLQPQIIGAVIAASTNVVMGIVLSYSAILIPQLERKDSDIVASRREMSWFASIFALTSIVSNLIVGYTMDKIGRINMLKLSVVPSVLGWVLIATAPNISMMVAGRICTGVATAFSGNPFVVYVTEIARKDMRGSLFSLESVFIALGILLTYFQGWLLNWRTIAWISNVFSVVPFLLLFLVPESPVWLISKGRIEEARKSLQWFHKYQPQPEDQDTTFAEMQLRLLIKQEERKKVEAAKIRNGTFREFLKPTGYKPLLILCGICFFQQFCGIYIFFSYLVSVFQDVGTTMDPYVASILVGVIRLIMSFSNTWIFKKFNRRSLLMTSGLGMAICTLISGLFTLWIKIGTTSHTWVPVIALLFFEIFAMIGFLPLPWIVAAEYFPLEIRSMGKSIVTCVVKILMFLAIKNYVNLKVALGGSAYIQWFFSFVSFLSVIYVFVVIPETHNKTLLEIEDYFNHNNIYLGQKKKMPELSSHQSEDTAANTLINTA